MLGLPSDSSPLRINSLLLGLLGDGVEGVDDPTTPTTPPMRIDVAFCFCFDGFDDEPTPSDAAPHFVSVAAAASLHEDELHKDDLSQHKDECSHQSPECSSSMMPMPQCVYQACWSDWDQQPYDDFDFGSAMQTQQLPQQWQWQQPNPADASLSKFQFAANSEFSWQVYAVDRLLALQLQDAAVLDSASALACPPKTTRTKRVRFASPEGGQPEAKSTHGGKRRSKGQLIAAAMKERREPRVEVETPQPRDGAERAEGTEEDWQRRITHRRAAIDYIKLTNTYKVFENDVHRGDVLSDVTDVVRPMTPDICDRNTCKRPWEKSVQAWRIALQRYEKQRANSRS